MSKTEIIEQRVNFKGLINSIDVKPEEYLLPLQEILVNSIQSINDKGNIDSGKIIIDLIRKNELSLDFKDGKDPAYRPVIGFTIQDNGIGFTKDRFEAFRTPYTDFGAKKHGCKGIGRYTVLACFGSMDIESYYNDKEGMKGRKLKFDNVRGLQNITEDSNKQLPKEVYTLIKLNAYKPPYLNYVTNNQISKESISKGLIQHCLLYFINDSAPKIFLKEKEDKLENAMVLNDIYKSVISIEKIEKEVEILGIESKFNLNYIRNYNGAQSHALHLCANNRQVGKKQTLTKFIPSFKELHDKDQKKYHLSLYVTSKFLDDKAQPQRNRFSIPDRDDKLTEFDKVSLEGLFKSLSEKVKNNYSEHICEAEKEKKDRIRSYILDKNKPRLRYKHLLNVAHAFEEIPINATDESLESALHEISFKLEQKRQKDFDKIFKKNKYDKEDFGKIVHEVLREETSFSKDKLADLMIKRKSILKLFRKYLEWRNEENYMLEKDLHNIIFTMSADTENTPYEYHNLWLLDERLTFYSFTASDKSIRSNKKIESKSQKEPDLFIYDVPYAYSDDPDKINAIVLFEFKRPGRDMDNSKDKKLDSQLEEYFLELSKSKAKNSKGRYVNIKDETPKFGYIVCELHKDLVDYNINWNGFKETPYGTLYKMNDKLNLYFEVIDYDHLVDFAERRHNAFFKALGIESI